MHRVHNCGSFLQAYALQEIVENLGYTVEIIDYHYPNLYHYEKLGYNPKDYQYSWRSMFHHLRHGRLQDARDMLFHLKFDILIDHKLHLSQSFFSRDALQLNPPHYDIYCLGSDQTLNPNYIFEDTSFLLGFAPQGSKRVAYAASITVPELNLQQETFFKTYLTDFKSISTRENTGARLLRKLLGRDDIQSVMDPVFLISDKEWQKKLGFKQKRKNYIFYYVLNYMSDVRDIAREQLSEEMKRGRYEGVIVVDGNKHIFPKEFVKTIANAGLVITDSFHATAFSMIFKTPVIPIIGENSKDIRINDLLLNNNIKLHYNIDLSIRYLSGALSKN